MVSKGSPVMSLTMRHRNAPTVKWPEGSPGTRPGDNGLAHATTISRDAYFRDGKNFRRPDHLEAPPGSGPARGLGAGHPAPAGPSAGRPGRRRPQRVCREPMGPGGAAETDPGRHARADL